MGESEGRVVGFVETPLKKHKYKCDFRLICLLTKNDDLR